MRTGYTTGATAAAAAKAAALALLVGERQSEVAITLPRGEGARFPLVEWEKGAEEARCGILKDAGDDPDVTHGALIRATVRRTFMPGFWVRGGVGVGTVTRPGLPVAVGSPAINPVPMRMIREAMEKALIESGGGERTGGLEVILSIPEGERLASHTLNARLGILGGLSLLGTTGIVIPYSVDAYRLSVRLALEIARAAGLEMAVLSTGRSSEDLAQRLLPQIPVESFVLAADYMGDAIQEASRLGFRRVILAGFPGKLGKFALGHRDTHERRGLLDLGALAALVPGSPAESWRKGFVAASSARWAMDLLSEEKKRALGQEIAKEIVNQGMTLTGSGTEIGGLVFSYEEERLGASPFWLEEIIGG